MSKTLGQAVDEAVTAHETRYGQSKVYSARVVVYGNGTADVELRADHFSGPLVYKVQDVRR